MLLLSTRESNETKLSNILIIIFILEKIDGPISKLNQFQTTVTHPSPSLSKYFDGLSYEPRILRLSFHSRNFYFLTRHGVHKCVLGTRRDARAAYRTTPVFKENAGRGRNGERAVEERRRSVKHRYPFNCSIIRSPASQFNGPFHFPDF